MTWLVVIVLALLAVGAEVAGDSTPALALGAAATILLVVGLAFDE